MRIFDPHAHMISRVTDDYERMAAAGVAAVLEPAFWLGQPRTSVGSFVDYFDAIIGWERFRAEQFGVRHYCLVGLNPKEANDPRVNDGVLEILPHYLEKDGVLGIGEIGFDDMTATEERVFLAQLELGKREGLPVLVHTPHRDKVKGALRTLDILRDMDFPLEMALIDHNTEETVQALIDSGATLGFSIYPNTKMSEERMVAVLQQYGTDRILVNSACDWGVSDPLKVPKTVAVMRQSGMSDEEIEKVVWRNPIEFFSRGGRLDLEELATPAAPAEAEALFQGNTILRGERVS
jgi:predicted metal-dependent TIM-barrel fold hydrolase